MMKLSARQRPISGFLSLVVFALFALCILCVLLSGVGAYRRLVSGGQESYAQRTCTQYISARVHQCRDGGSLRVEPFDGVQALVLTEPVEGELYDTRVYCWDGWLMELFSAREGEFSPEDGEQLLPAQAMEPALEDGLLKVTVVDEFGRESRLVFSLRGGEGAVP